MENNNTVESKLSAPFPESEIEWRVQSQGVKQDGKPWCMVLAYVSARAIQRRLDEVFGCLNWKDEYSFFNSNDEKGNLIQNMNVICKLSAWDSSKSAWITKENGAPETHVEAFKGGISSAFKRVASSGYGIGRYLYYLDTKFAEVSEMKPNGGTWIKGTVFDKKNNKWSSYFWAVPKLPAWAIPKETKK